MHDPLQLFEVSHHVQTEVVTVIDTITSQMFISHKYQAKSGLFLSLTAVLRSCTQLQWLNNGSKVNFLGLEIDLLALIVCSERRTRELETNGAS